MQPFFIDEGLIPELYKLSQRLKKPLPAVINNLLRESLPYAKLRLNQFELVQVPFHDFEDTLTLKRTEKRFAHLYVCPICSRNFDPRRGNVLAVKLKNRSLKILICSNCHREEEGDEPERDC